MRAAAVALRLAAADALSLASACRPQPTAAAAAASCQQLQQPWAAARQWRWFSGDSASSNDSSSAVFQLSETTTLLRNLHNGAEIFLVGTAHVSKASAEEVRQLIRAVQPQAVMLELCAGRAARLRSGAAGDQEFLQQMLGGLAAPGNSFSQKLVQLSLPLMYRVLKAVGMEPGVEFKAALEEADRCGARLIYGDRDVQQTLKRFSEAVDLQQLMRMATGVGLPDPPPEVLRMMQGGGGGGLEAQVEGMKSRAAVRAMAGYIRQVNPGLAKALIDERDELMTQSLVGLEGRNIGVCGLAHLDGIERRWEALQLGSAALAAPA